MYFEDLAKKIENPKLLELIHQEFEKPENKDLIISLESEADKNTPYLTHYHIKKVKKYNPHFEGRKCVCGHNYSRHFDSYEDDLAVGCKYCSCNEYVEVEDNLLYEIHATGKTPDLKVFVKKQNTNQTFEVIKELSFFSFSDEALNVDISGLKSIFSLSEGRTVKVCHSEFLSEENAQQIENELKTI